jgi:hypothetical protein
VHTLTIASATAPGVTPVMLQREALLARVAREQSIPSTELGDV